MPEFKPKPYTSGAVSGIKIALRATAAGAVYVSVTINKATQEQHFGAAMPKGTRFAVTLNSDPNKCHVMGILKDPNGAIEAKPGMKGTITLNMARWTSCPTTSQRAKPCAVAAADVGALMIRLPEWAKPKEGITG